MTNRQIAKLLQNVAAAYSIKDEKKYRFQIIAYEKAADAILNSTSEVKHLYEENRLDEIPGVGSSLKLSLQELMKTGEVKHFSDILSGVSPALFPLLEIPSFGPKKAQKIVTHFKLRDPKTVIDDVEKLAKEGKIASVEGFGEKSEKDILQAISEFRQGKSKDIRMPLPFASELAEKILEYLKLSPDVITAYPLGSLRRQRDTIGDIDIAVATEKNEAVLSYFTDYPYKERVIQSGENEASILVTGGTRVDLRVQSQGSFGSLLQHFTGSKEHNIHLREYALKNGHSLSEYGIKTKGSEKLKKYKKEEDFYRALGLDWVPPEIREDTGEIEAAVEGRLPKLVELKDIKGDFHLHSSFPIEPSHDLGRNTMKEMAGKAVSLGYDYIGFSEHNPSVSMHTKDQELEIIKKRSMEIERTKNVFKKLRVFSLLETDILANGSLGISNDSLDLLDGTLVSIHSSFGMDKKSMTERVLKGLSHPKAKILAHPTGRLINERTGFDLEWEKIFEYCTAHHKALEINASPYRLDLRDTLVKEAVQAGVKLFINTDSHAVDQMDLMQYGVSVARRGWATKADVLNTWNNTRLDAWFQLH